MIKGSSSKCMEKVAKYFNYDVANLVALEVIEDLNAIIDIWGEEETLETTGEMLKIPFHRLKSEFPKLPKDKEYLPYCT